jgi:heat-inducible transcriptional repressor
MSTSIGEMSDRARDVFRMVVEAYLESGHRSARAHLAHLDPQSLAASIRNVMQDLEESGLLAAPHTSAGADPDRKRAPPVRRRHHAGRRARAEDRAAIEALIDRGGPIEEASATPPPLLSGLSACTGIVL